MVEGFCKDPRRIFAFSGILQGFFDGFFGFQRIFKGFFGFQGTVEGFFLIERIFYR